MEEKYITVLQQSLLFQGLSDKEINSFLACLDAHEKNYRKGTFILHSGDTSDKIGIVLKGSADVIKEDYWGNSNIVELIQPSELFVLSYACVGTIPVEVNVRASENTDILFINAKRLLTTCASSCGFHNKLISNLVKLLASKNIMMNQKISYISQRTTREKIMTYLSAMAVKNKSSEFEIPFNRQQMADYLSVERTALSGELGRMAKEGVIEFRRSWFRVRGGDLS